jgi:CHASE2 domain-containing sensor protein
MKLNQKMTPEWPRRWVQLAIQVAGVIGVFLAWHLIEDWLKKKRSQAADSASEE